MSTSTVTAEEIAKFTTKNRREIVFYLQQLANDGDRVSVVFDSGRETVLTVLIDVDVDNNQFIFDWGGSETANRKLLSSDRAFFVCAPQGVRNQFSVSGIREIVHKNRRAFSARLPDQYTRLQRREYFRLVLPVMRRLPCVIPRDGGRTITLTIMDISVGGIAAELPGSRLPFKVGDKLPRASIDLKSIGKIEVDLEVRNSSDVSRGGKVSGRIGCSFTNLGSARENLLQRLITDVQREQRARLGK